MKKKVTNFINDDLDPDFSGDPDKSDDANKKKI